MAYLNATYSWTHRITVHTEITRSGSCNVGRGFHWAWSKIVNNPIWNYNII